MRPLPEGDHSGDHRRRDRAALAPSIIQSPGYYVYTVRQARDCLTPAEPGETVYYLRVSEVWDNDNLAGGWPCTHRPT